MMGDEDTYTREELEILGEAPVETPTGEQETPPAEDAAPTTDEKPAEEKPAEGAEKPAEDGAPKDEAKEEPAGHTEEEKKAVESEGARIEGGFVIDDEGTKIPITRWRKLYATSKEAERTAEIERAKRIENENKFKLFKSVGPEKYFSMFPDEAPSGGYKPPQAARQTAQPDPLDLVAQYPDPNHQYHGLTLRDIYNLDAAEARRLERIWEQGQKTAERTAEERKQRMLRDSEEEINTFTADYARERYGKDAKSLSPKEEAEVSKTIQDTLDWMKKTGRGAGVLADAYFIMNREKIISEERTKAGKKALEALNHPSIPSIGGGGRGPSGSMSAYETMSADQLAETISNMDDRAAVAFLKNAPEALKAKYPGIPWS
jgi:hypothetical protein